MNGSMMRWLLGGILASVAACAVARTFPQIREGGVLRICVAGSSAAFYRANGEAFAAFLGLKAEVRELASFDHQFHNAQGVTVRDERYDPGPLADGSCDVYPNDLHVVPWRESKMLIVPYYTVRNVVVAHRDYRGIIKGVADLGGRTAAVQKGTNYDAWIEEANETQLAGNPVRVLYAPTVEAVKRVAEAKADFTVVGSEGALKWVREDIARLTILFPVDEPIDVGWGVARNAPVLAKQLQLFFDASKHVDSPMDVNWRNHYRVSLMEYGLFEASFNEGRIDVKKVLEWTVPAAVAILLLLASMVFWNRRLKREVAERRAVEGALRIAHGEQNAIFESATVGIALVVDRVTVNCNRRLAELAGGVPGDFIGKTSQRWYPDPTAYAETTAAYEVLGRGETYRREVKLQRKNGKSGWARLSARAVEPSDLGKGAVWMVEDISEEHAAAEALRLSNEQLAARSTELAQRETFIRALFDSSPSGLALTTPAGEFRYLSPR